MGFRVFFVSFHTHIYKNKHMSSELDGLSLGQLYSAGQSILTELEDTSLSSIDPAYQAKVNTGIQQLTRANHLVTQLDIFSDNELLDEINTNDLKFLLVPAYLGDLTLKMSGADQERNAILTKARVSLIYDTYRFIHRC